MSAERNPTIGSGAAPAATFAIHRINLAGQIRYELRRPDSTVVGHFMTIAAAERAAVDAAAWRLTLATISRAARRCA